MGILAHERTIGEHHLWDNYKMVFDSPINPSLHMLHEIGTHNALASRACEDIIAYRRQALQGHLWYNVAADDLAHEIGSMTYQVYPLILNLLTHNYRQLIIHADMGMVRPRHHLLVTTTLCIPEHLMDWILLPAYLNRSLHNYTINPRTSLRARALVRN